MSAIPRRIHSSEFADRTSTSTNSHSDSDFDSKPCDLFRSTPRHQQQKTASQRWCYHILFTLLLLLVHLQPVRAAASNGSIGVTYSLSATDFINVSTTIPPEFQYGDGSRVQWSPIFSQAFIESQCSWLSCYSFPITIKNMNGSLGSPFPIFDVAVSWVFVNNNGLIAFSLEEPVKYFPNTLSVPQPDPLFDEFNVEAMLLFGDMTQLIWQLRNDSLWTSTLYSNQDPTAYILLIRGTLTSTSNMMRTSSPFLTSIDFQVQLHSQTKEVIMHIINLQHATSADLLQPIQIGLVRRNQQASVWAQYNAFQTAPAVSKTLRWSRVDNLESCIATSCSACLNATTSEGQCGWCASTSTCFSVSLPAGNRSHLCPETLALTSCPAATLFSCDSCIKHGNWWCSGDANCNYIDYIESVVPNLNLSSPTLPLCSTDVWFTGDNMMAQMFAKAAPFCVPLGTPCALQTCNEMHNSLHMGCTAKTYRETPYLFCDCESNWETVSDTQACNGCSGDYYADESGDCITCPPLTPLLITMLIVAAGVITFLLVKLNGSKKFQRCLVPVQNSIVFFQVISLLSLIDFRWPLSVKHMVSISSILGLNFFRIPSVNCYFQPENQLAAAVVAPILVALLLLFAMGVIKTFLGLKRCCGRLTKEAHYAQTSSVEVTFIRAYLSFLTLSYNFICNTILQNLQTKISYISNEDTFAIIGDPEVRDILILFAIYILGIPLALVLLIAPPSRNGCLRCCCQCGCCCSTPSQRTQALIPLVGKYRSSGISRYWEATVVPGWKFSLNAIIVLASGSLQIWLLASLLVLLVLSYAFVKPYVHGINNREQSILLTGSLLVLFSGLLFYAASPASTTGRKVLLVFSYILIFSTMVCMIAVIVYVLVQAIREKFDEDQSEETESTHPNEVHEENEDSEDEIAEPSQIGSLTRAATSLPRSKENHSTLVSPNQGSSSLTADVVMVGSLNAPLLQAHLNDE